jgi:OOP family OmpA-OmpF porin
MSSHVKQGHGARMALAALAVLAGCATRNETLERARESLAAARQTTEIAQYAPVALAEAGQALRRAERAGGREETTHLAYIAERKVEIARQLAAQRQAEQGARQLQQELVDLKAKDTDRGPVVILGDVLFETGRSQLRPGARQNLYKLVDFLKHHPDRPVVIEGHTDSRGSESYNLDLSERRARSVEAFLSRSGIDPGRITARGYGEAYPVAPNDTQAGRLQNRRVEVYLPQPGQGVAGRERR